MRDANLFVVEVMSARGYPVDDMTSGPTISGSDRDNPHLRGETHGRKSNHTPRPQGCEPTLGLVFPLPGELGDGRRREAGGRSRRAQVVY